jgi:hypothetical protein
MNVRPRPTAEELQALKAQLEERFPAWRYAGIAELSGDYCLRAERIGTLPDRQAASDADGLLQVIEERERFYTNNSNAVVQVRTGVSGTHD